MTNSPTLTPIAAGLQHQRAGRFAEAEQVYKLLLQEQPDSVDALNLLGALVYEDSRYEEAQDYFERVLNLKPGAESHNSMGIVLKARGHYQEAVDHYRQALTLKPEQPEVLSNLGNALKEIGELEEAIAVYEQALALRPNYAEAHNNLGIIYKERGDLDKASRCYREALSLKPNYAEAHHNLGIVLGIQGKAEEAVRYFQQAIALKPNYADAYLNLGSTLQQQGKLEEAIAQYQRLLALKPNHADGANSLALALQQQGDIDGAIAAFKRALELRPNFPGVCNNLGNLLLETEQTEAAIAHYERAIELRPNYPEALNNLGNALQKQGQIPQAIANYRKALELKPNFVEALSNLGAVLKDQHKLPEAVSCLEQAVSLNDGFAEIHNNLGNAYQEQKRHEDAIACYLRAVELKPDMAEVRSNLGNMLQYMGDFEGAFEQFHKAIEVQPDFAGVYNNLGITYRNSGQVQEAFAAYDRAIELKPDFVEAHWNKALNYLLMGDFAQGFAGYEWRFKWTRFIEQNPARTYAQPRWQGESLAGKTILLYSEQGMGDTIQFIRYIPLVAAQGGRIVLECHPPLKQLFQNYPGLDRFVSYGEPLPEFDVHAPLMSLAYIFRSTQETIPRTVPYLSAPTTPQLPPPHQPTDLKVGLVWNGNPENPYNRHRAVPLKDLLFLAELPGITVYSLQKEPTPEDLERLQAQPQIVDLRSQLNDFTDTAALINQLDLVISIDTAVTHLAGALGKPVWLLLPYAPDWRWMLERPDSPWYPTMRLFRQTVYGEWDGVLHAVQTAIAEQLMAMGVASATITARPTRLPKPKPKKKSKQPQRVVAPVVPKSSNLVGSGFNSEAPRSPATTTGKESTSAPSAKALPEGLKAAIRHHQAGRVEAAWQTCETFLQQEPESAEGWHLLGLMAHHQRKLDEAIAHYRKSLVFDPEHCDSYNNLAVALHEQGKRSEAIPYYQKVLALKPDYSDAHNNYANALREQGDLDGAIAHYQQAIELRPDYADAYNNLGLAYYAQNDFAQAAEAYRQAIAKRPNYPQALNHLGNALKELGNFAEAATYYQQAIALKPDYAKAFNNWGNIFRDEGDLQTALQYYEQATSLDENFVEAHWNKALTLLLGGDLKRGFAEYEWRRHVNLPTFKSLRDFPGPRWDGGALNGQVIYLHAEQGMGDVIQFVRYVPLVVGQGGRVVLECHHPLQNLLSTIPGVEQLVPYGSPPPEYQVQFPLLSLPALFETSSETVPAAVPYLWPPASAVVLPPARSPQACKVGVVWSGNPENPYNRTRAVPLELLCTLTEIPEIEFYSLQKDLTPSDQDLLKTHSEIHNLQGLMTDFVDTAALIQQLDLIISVDTAVTHLAGALGKPVWLLLPYAPDWRWMLHRADSPWYPTMQIFRQPTYGDWETVLTAVRDRLADSPQAALALPSPAPLPPTPFAIIPPPLPQPEAPPLDQLLTVALADYQSGRLPEAERLYRQALQTHPNHPDALHVLAVILAQTQRSGEAVPLLRQLTTQQPEFGDGWRNLGGVLQETGDVAGAVVAYERAIALNPQDADAHQNLSLALLALDRPQEAVFHAEQVLALRPDFADGYYNLGYGLRRAGQLAAAIAQYRRAIALKPDFAIAHKNLGHALLLLGELAEGFQEIEWRWQQPGWAPRPFPQPEWDGSDLHGQTILLYAEQGLGDTMQFIRYAPLVKARGATVIVECQAALLTLFAQVEGVDRWVAQDTPLPEFDTHAPLMSLPRLLGTTLETVPAPIELRLPLAARSPLVPNPQTLNVGIVWAGNPTHRNDRWRSCPLEQFQPLFELPGITFYSLQKGDAAQVLRSQPDLPVVDLSDRLTDFVETAAAIAQLDLVITVDTAVAHLAGTLGKPVWVLLAFAPDWRWIVNRDDSPWYPSLRLFRQTQPSDWESVFAQVIPVLRDRAAQVRPPAPTPGSATPALAPVGLTWPLNGSTPAGILGSYLAMHGVEGDRAALTYTAHGELSPFHEAWLRQCPGDRAQAQVQVELLGDRLLPLHPSPDATRPKLGIVILEDTTLNAAAIARARTYQTLITGCQWTTDLLQHHGLNPVQLPLQGVDLSLFQPGTAVHPWGDRFLIFSSGTPSYAQGHDLVLAAYAAFRSRHPDALLVTSWTEAPAAIATLAHSSHCTAPSHPDLAHWLAVNALDEAAVINLGPVPYALLGQVLRGAAVAVFAQRCEPGINPTLLASFACGVPTILSNNTGHQPFVQQNLGFPLQFQRPVTPNSEMGTSGWGETDVEELVELLEHIYTQRQTACQRGKAAIDEMESWQWQTQLAQWRSRLSAGNP